jgi:protease IV
MPRSVNALAIAAVLLAVVPRATVAQLSAIADRGAGLPAGIALPVIGAAAAEEPTALSVNPAGIGFVGAPALQIFHESDAEPGSDGDGFWLVNPLGPAGLGFSMEWIRPGSDEGPRYRRTRLGLSVGDRQSASLGFAWSWWSSPDPDLERLTSWDVGLTLRPVRALSIGLALLGNDAQLGNGRVPLRYDLGLGTRLWRDRFTLAADLLADDRGERFRPTHVTAGAGLETPLGLALALQVQVPVRDEPNRKDAVATLLTLTWNDGNVGWTGGATASGDDTGWLVGARVSGERYLSPGGGPGLPRIDLDEALRRRRFLFLDIGERDPYGALLERLEEARDDPDVAGLVLAIDGLGLSGGRIEELRGLVASIRTRKPVFAWLEGGGTREYWLASAATAIAAPPGAPLFVNGIGTSQLFVRNALARIGIGFEVVKAGAYKSASEPLVRSEASPESREAVNAVLDDVYGRFVSDVATARDLPAEKVRTLVDQGLFTTEEARAAGLVDAAIWPDEIEGWARRVGGRRFQDTGPYRPHPPRAAQRWGKRPIIEVVRLEGVIARKARDPFGTGTVASAERAAGAIARAARDPDVKAIVLRIESPGGDGLASDLLWREVMRAKRRKPVIASMGDVAASGGYLVAAAADAIVAEPSTLTGSIGVFVLKPDLSGLLEKLSIRREAYTRGENAQLTAVTKPWSPAERKVIEKQIDAFYSLFLDRVAEGRKLTRAEVEAVAAGRVWTGHQAYERRMVDRLGSLADAIALARERARLGAGDETELRRSADGAGGLAAPLAAALEAAAPEPLLARAVRASPDLSTLLLLSEMGPVLALPEAWFDAP